MDATKLRDRLAKNVRDLAKKRGIGLNALADKIGMSRGTIHYIATSQVATTVDTIARVADGLGVDPADLLRK